MKILTNVKKTFPELTFAELKSVVWESVTLSELKTITARELVFANYYNMREYFKENQDLSILTDGQWVGVIQRERKDSLFILFMMADIDNDFARRFYLDNRAMLPHLAAHEGALANRNIIKLSETNAIVNNWEANNLDIPVQERILYLQNSNFLYELYWDTYDNPLLLSSDDMAKVGLTNMYRGWTIEEHLTSDQRDAVYSKKYYHIVGDKALTWDHAIAIMTAYPEMRTVLHEAVCSQWNIVNPLDDVKDQDSLHKANKPTLED